MSKPVRIQLSRRKGFDLQAASMAVNGLPAVNVARPGKWGNPFKVEDGVTPFMAVKKHRRLTMCQLRQWPELMGPAFGDLRGKNLACWCGPGQPCHADTLLEIANRWNLEKL